MGWNAPGGGNTKKFRYCARVETAEEIPHENPILPDPIRAGQAMFLAV